MRLYLHWDIAGVLNLYLELTDLIPPADIPLTVKEVSIPTTKQNREQSWAMKKR